MDKQFERQSEFYEAFFGHRVPPSQVKGMERGFKQMINTLREDLLYYHKDVEPAKLKEAIIIALTVMHRLDAKHPNVYTKVVDIGMRAFKHADRFLTGDPLPLPAVADEEELWDIRKTQREEQFAYITAAREQRAAESTPPSKEESRRVSDFLKQWRENPSDS